MSQLRRKRAGEQALRWIAAWNWDRESCFLQLWSHQWPDGPMLWRMSCWKESVEKSWRAGWDELRLHSLPTLPHVWFGLQKGTTADVSPSTAALTSSSTSNSTSTSVKKNWIRLHILPTLPHIWFGLQSNALYQMSHHYQPCKRQNKCTHMKMTRNRITNMFISTLLHQSQLLPINAKRMVAGGRV